MSDDTKRTDVPAQTDPEQGTVGSAAGIGRRLAVPSALFLIFLGLSLFSQEMLAQFGAEAVSQGRKVASYTVQIGIWLASAFFVNRLLSVFFWELGVERAVGAPVPRLVKDILAILIFLVALSGIISFVFNQPVTGIWATSGAVGIVVGFALRSMILDVFSGLAVNIDRSYRIGDWVQLHGRQPGLHIIGNIQEINWRTTRLRTTDNNMVIVPNSVMGQTIVTNFMTPEPKSRQELYFTLDFPVPSDRALRVLGAAVRAVCGDSGPLEKPPAKVLINTVSSVGVEYCIRYWIVPADLSPKRSRHIVVSSVLAHLKNAGLTLAYPKRDLFTAEMPSRQLDASSEADLRALVGRIELFEHLGDEELALLTETITRRVYSGGDMLIQRGDVGDSMFILVEGLVYVFADVAGDGQEMKVAQIVPGQFFGEMSLLTGEARSATITAASDAVAYEIGKDAMAKLLQRRPELAEVLSRIVAERKLRNEEALAEATREEKEEHRTSVAGQILGRMRDFFRGVLGP
ncbi:MAG: mechanosensitive ion channel family protein [Myxococcota bacterium]|nr:mechanosensitive ion channel family protein [Myxococcota bacterium]